MTDAEQVAAIERRHELALLDRLLEEATRPVPPAPHRTHRTELLIDAGTLVELMRLLATTYTPGNRYRLRSVA